MENEIMLNIDTLTTPFEVVKLIVSNLDTENLRKFKDYAARVVCAEIADAEYQSAADVSDMERANKAGDTICQENYEQSKQINADSNTLMGLLKKFYEVE